MVVQLLAVGIIAWAAAARSDEPLAPAGRRLFLLILLMLGLIALQVVPLPPLVWPYLGGREAIASGYRVLGLPVPAFPLSLTPYATLSTFLTLLPPLAVICGMLRLNAYRPQWLALALLAGAIAGVLLGALQVTSADPETSPWYLYAETNLGIATGFFANANHMAILLVITLPFLAALLASARGANVQRYSAAVALVGGASLVILVGIALNTSLAGYALSVPVLIGSVMIVLPATSPLRRWGGPLAGLLLVGAVVALWLSPVAARGLGAEASSSVHSRQTMVWTTLRAAGDFMPFGSGLGSFRPVYQLYEPHDDVDPVRVNHAHSDYVELALETGVPGLVLIGLFLAWWAAGAWRSWRLAEAGPYARAASIASAAILAHSLVDYPLRTAAISSAFAMCLALLAQGRPTAAGDKRDLWATRHLVLR
jgi:O-antigen ligase